MQGYAKVPELERCGYEPEARGSTIHKWGSGMWTTSLSWNALRNIHESGHFVDHISLAGYKKR